MTHRVLIPLASGQWIALELEAFQEGLRAAAEVMPEARPGLQRPSEAAPLMTAEQIGAHFGVDPSWFLARARLNEIPHVRAGKYVRFDATVVAGYLARPADTRSSDPLSAPKHLIPKGASDAVSKRVSETAKAKGGRHGG